MWRPATRSRCTTSSPRTRSRACRGLDVVRVNIKHDKVIATTTLILRCRSLASSKRAPIALMEDVAHGVAVVRSVEGLGGWSLECPAGVTVGVWLVSEQAAHPGPVTAWLETGARH